MPTFDRRTLLRAGGGLVAATVVGSTGIAEAAGPGGPAKLTTRNPLVEQRADPFITRPVNGMYYLTASVPEYDRLVVRGASTIDGLSSAQERVIWRRPSSGKMGGHIWAPELHRIDGRWYVYFAAGDSDNVFRIRTYVMESTAADPRADSWVLRGQLMTKWDTFTLDSTTFEHRGKRYLVWAQGEPGIETNSNLYLAEMASPLALKGEPVRLSVPTLPWEIQGFKVNEGPAVLIRNGRVFVTYSASATDARYCLGLLTADERSDLLDPRSWTKSPQPVFTTNDRTGQYGPGHNSFTVAEDGKTDVLVYHVRDYRDIIGDPLYDPNRHTRVQQLHWNDDGTPSFGVPVGKGGTIVRLSPLDAPDLFVRHADYRLRVDGGIREVADSQFRIVPGFSGSGSVALQSVNFPERYARVVDPVTVRLDPDDHTDSYARSASFVQVAGLADRRAASFRLAGDSAAFFAHDNGRFVLTRPGGAQRERQRASFWLS